MIGPTEHPTETGPVPAPQSPGRRGRRGSGDPHAPRIFGSFWIDETEFAIEVGAIKEVVNEQKSLSKLPLAPAFMAGLFNLRGMIVPVLDLRKMFEFPDFVRGETDDHLRKIAIIENGNNCIGLLFDSAGEVLNEQQAGRVDFPDKEGEAKDVVVEGILKLDGGERMLQILDPYRLLNIERVPQSAATAYDVSASRANLGKRRSCITLQIGKTCCAFDLRFVQEVAEMPPVQASLLAHGAILGTVNLRGSVIPVVDFRSYMANEPAFKLGQEALQKRKLLIMRTAQGLIGLMVFSIDSILPYFERDILPFAKNALPRAEIVTGCLVTPDEELVMLLDHARLLADPELSEPARICQEVHTDGSTEDAMTRDKASDARKTFIIFTADQRFSIDTDFVNEIINYPDNLLKPPYSLPFVEGIINLRGELITLVNLRSLYGLGEAATGRGKVLIFTCDGQKYAIMVDTVDEIALTTAAHISDERTPGFSETNQSAVEDILGYLSVPRDGQDTALVMIMNVEALVARCNRLSTDYGVQADFGDKPISGGQGASPQTQPGAAPPLG